MKENKLTIPFIGLFGVTRALIGAGVGLLLADRFARGQRRTIAWIMIGAGALSTVPFGITMVRARRQMNGKRAEPESMPSAYANR